MAGALNGFRHFALMLSASTRNSAGKDLGTLGNELSEPCRILIIYFLDLFSAECANFFLFAESAGAGKFLIFIHYIGVILWGVWYLIRENEWYNIFALGVALVIFMTVINSNVFFYAFIGRYENTFINIFKNVIVRQLQFFKFAVIIFLIVAVEGGILLYLFYLNIIGGVLGLLIWPGFIVYSVCLVTKEIFRQIEENQ